jgi:hypothetical protein
VSLIDQKVWDPTFTPEHITSAFKTCGIVPYNVDRVERDFVVVEEGPKSESTLTSDPKNKTSTTTEIEVTVSSERPLCHNFGGSHAYKEKMNQSRCVCLRPMTLFKTKSKKKTPRTPKCASNPSKGTFWLKDRMGSFPSHQKDVKSSSAKNPPKK